VIFSTHLLPLARGILSTIYVTLSEFVLAPKIETIFRKFYTGRPMVRIWPAGSLPELQHVAHTNSATSVSLWTIPANASSSSLASTSWQGRAGQAVQNFNLTLGIEEQTALQ